MSWLSRLFGDGAKTTGSDASPDMQKDDGIDALAWRNKYMAARIQHLDKKLKKKSFGGVTAFILPEDVETGTQEHLQTLNETLTSRIEYLEDILKGR